MSRWTYGNAWEHYPIRPGEIWQAGTGRVAVWNLFDGAHPLLGDADMLFVDPPWNIGNLNSFYTKAGRDDYHDTFDAFLDVLFAAITAIAPRVCYLEMGNQHVETVFARMPFPITQRWQTVYYRTKPNWLIRGSNDAPTDMDFTGMDEAKAIQWVGQHESYHVLGDCCMGRGLVGKAAFAHGRRFVGTELNERRLACLLQDIAKAGGEVRNETACAVQ